MDDLLARARRLATATLGDVLDGFGIPGVMSGIPRRAGEGRVAGVAQTMLAHVGPLGAYTFTDFTVGSAFDAVTKDAVLVADLGGAEVSTFGGLAALAVTVRGAAGVVIDGACRDLEEIRSSGLSLAARHVTPRTGKGRLKVIALGAPVSCGAVTVRPGDLVIMDDTGVVAIPADQIEKVLTAAEELDKRDTAFAEQLRQGKTFSESAAALKHA